MIEVKPWPHQTEFVDLQRGLPGCAAFFEMGLGKTYATIQALRDLMNRERRLRRTLIFTKPLVVPQWEEEWLKFSKIERRHITLLQGPQTKRNKHFIEKGFTPEGEPVGHIFITNTEALSMKELMETAALWKPEALVFDETHELKNHAAKRSEIAANLANPWDKRNKCPKPKPKTFILSGSPVLNTSLDIFQQVKIMLGGFPSYNWFNNYNPSFLVTNYYHFRARYFRDINAHKKGTEDYEAIWKPMTMKEHGFDAEAEIGDILRRISVRATKSVLNLPAETAIVQRVPMLKEQGRVYEEMRDEFLSYVTATQVARADVSIVKALRLMQIVSGFVSTEGRGEELDRSDLSWGETPKDEALIDILETVTPTSKILVWAVWQENYERIRQILKRLNIDYVEAHGQLSNNAKLESVEQFKSNSRKRVFLGHPGSGGVGLNLVGIPGTEDRCAYSCFFSRNFSLAQYIQARARNHRSGQTENVTHYDLTCKGTIDEMALRRLGEKAAIGDRLLSPAQTLSIKDIVNDLKQV